MDKQFENLFKFNKELQELINPILDKKVTAKNLKNLLLCLAIGKAYKTHKAIILLCQNGYGEDAAILARSLFELYVTHAYIAKDDTDKRAERFQDYDWLIRKKMFEYALSKPEVTQMIKDREAKLKQGEDITETVLKEAELAQSRYNYDQRLGWAVKNIRGMAEEIGRLEAYSTVYRLTSNMAHSAPRAINEYAKPGEEGIIINTYESENWVEETLVISFDYFYSLILLWNQQLSLGLEDKLKDLEDGYIKEVDKANEAKEHSK